MFNRSSVNGTSAHPKPCQRRWSGLPGSAALQEGAGDRTVRPPQDFLMSVPESPVLDRAPGDTAGGQEDRRTSGQPKHHYPWAFC